MTNEIEGSKWMHAENIPKNDFLNFNPNLPEVYTPLKTIRIF